MRAMPIAFIPSPSSSTLQLGPLSIHFYGLTLLVAIAAAVLVAGRRWTNRGGDWDLIFRVAVWGVAFGIVGARLYHVATSWNELPNAWWGPFAIWKGGLGIWGGIFFGVLGGLYIVRKRLTHGDVLRFMDAAAPGLLVAQAIGRIGNYFNQELFGKPSTLPWALKIDPDHRPPGYAHFATYQPTFLYEIIWNLGLAGFLIWLGSHRKIKPPGLLALYVAGYSAFRMFEETLRIDYSVHVLGMRLNFWIATLICVAGLAWFVWIQKRGKTEPLPLDGPKTDARDFLRRKPSGYRKPPAPTYGKKSRSASRR